MLYPAPIRDTLLRTAAAGLYRPLWTDKILSEVEGVMLRKGYPAANCARLRSAMNGSFEDALVTGWEEYLPLATNHPKDRHVVAAAIRSGADVIVTANLSDFPAAALKAHDVDVQSPDMFLCYELEHDPPTVIGVLENQARDTGRHGHQKLTVNQVLDRLAAAGLTRFPTDATEWAETLTDAPPIPPPPSDQD